MKCQACGYLNPPEGTIDNKCDECGSLLVSNQSVKTEAVSGRTVEQYTLNDQAESRYRTIEVSYEPGWEDLKVCVDSEEVGHFPNREALEMGQTFNLDSDTQLAVKLDIAYRRYYVKLLLNKKPVKGAASETIAKINDAVGVSYLIGIVTLLIGGISLFSPTVFFDEPVAAVGALLTGGFVVLLAMLTAQGYKSALLIIFGLFAFDTASFAWSVLQSGQYFPFLFIIFVRIGFIQQLAQGLEGFESWKKQPVG